MKKIFTLVFTITSISVVAAIPEYDGKDALGEPEVESLNLDASDQAIRNPFEASKDANEAEKSESIELATVVNDSVHRPDWVPKDSVETIYKDLLHQLNFSDVEEFRNNANRHTYQQIMHWAISYPEFALQWLTTTATPEKQAELELFILHRLLPENIILVYEYSSGLVLPVSIELVESEYAKFLATSDAPSAFEWAMQLYIVNGNKQALGAVAVVWANEEYASFLSRLTLIADAELSDYLFSRVTGIIAKELVTDTPVFAMAWADTLADRRKQQLLPAFFSTWIATDSKEQRQAAREWLHQQPESSTKQLMQQSYFWSALQSNDYSEIDYAIALFSGSLSTTEFAAGKAHTLTTVLIQKRPDEVQYFIDSLVDPHLKKSAIVAQREQLMLSDPQQYLDLYSTLDQHERINFIATVLFWLEPLQPSLVARWIESNPISIEDKVLVDSQIELFKENHRC